MEKIETVRDLVGALGRANVIEACGVSTQQVSNWIAQGYISPRRYLALKRLCEDKGVALPEHLVFREPAQ